MFLSTTYKMENSIIHHKIISSILTKKITIKNFCLSVFTIFKCIYILLLNMPT